MDKINNNDLISRKAVLDYLNKELNNISQPKENKPIPAEARVGVILTIKTMIKFIEGLK